MLTASTVYVVLGLRFYVVEVPGITEEEPSPEVLRRLNDYNVAMSWMSRLNVSTYMLL